MIRVVVAGASGRMGREVCLAVSQDNELELVGAIEAGQDNIDTLKTDYRNSSVKIGASLSEVINAGEADVLVDFTQASALRRTADMALKLGLDIIIGTTGLSDSDLSHLKKAAANSSSNILLAPNFAMGAVLLMKLAETVAAYAERAEIIELHHDKKADAPSGTAKLTAELMGRFLKQPLLDETENIKGVRGGIVDNIPIHSVRLPGLVAHQEVIFGFKGQTLTIRHDSIARSSFMPGVILAIKNISKFRGFTYGLDKIMGLSDK